MRTFELVLMVTAVVSTIAGLVKLWHDIQQVYRAVNGRLDQLVKVIRESERAKGKLEGAAEERAAIGERAKAILEQNTGKMGEGV